jgi:hypothetical protein
MQPFQPTYRRFIFIFALLVTLAGISMLSHGALAQTDIAALTNKVFLPLISGTQDIGGTIPHG